MALAGLAGGDARLPAGQHQVGDLHVNAGAAGAVLDVTHRMLVPTAPAAFAAPEAVGAVGTSLTRLLVTHAHP